MIRDDLERIRVHDGFAAMCRARAEVEAAAVALYPTMSIRDIARDLDTSVPFVRHAAEKAGFPPRPVAMTPGDERTARRAGGRKLTEAQVAELRADFAAGETAKAVGARYGIHRRTASQAAYGEHYAWVPGALPHPLSSLSVGERSDYDVFRRKRYSRADALRSIGRADLAVFIG